MLNVTLYNQSGDTVLEFSDEPDTEEFQTDGGPVKYVSLVAPSTYGPLPLFSPGKDGRPGIARVEDEVLYINTGHIAAFKVKRISE